MIKQAIGLGEGGTVRSALDGLLQQCGLDRWMGPRDARNRVVFTIAVVALTAKLSKADGISTPIEAAAFAEVYHVTGEEADNVARLYDLAKQDVAGFEAYARQIAAALADEPELKHDVLEGLFHVATADGVLHEAEEHYLASVADAFGFDRKDYQRTRALFVRDAGDPYVIMGVTRDLPDLDLKAAYRRLVKEHHPDTLIGHGVPKEFVDQATRKLATINEAYAAIAKERGL